MKSSHSKIFTQLFFALLLLVVQVQISSHQADLNAHTGESACEFCIHFSHVGDGVFSDITEIAPAGEINVFHIPRRTKVTWTFSFYLPQTRAPPASSLI